MIRTLRIAFTALFAFAFVGCSDDGAPADPSHPHADDTGGAGGGGGTSATTGGNGGSGGEACDGMPCPCSVERPTGMCPGGRVCAAGACIVELGSGEAVDPATAPFFEELWTLYDESYGAFATKSVDWAAVHDEVVPRIAAAKTAFEARWLVTEAVSRIGDGHTAAVSYANCKIDPGFGQSATNLEACATEIDGKLYVYRVLSGNPTGLEIGDELLDVDGRTMDIALADLAAQPRCFVGASREEHAHAQLVASMLFRPTGDQTLRVRRNGGEEVALPIAASDDLLACDGRIGPSVALTSHGFGIHSTVLEGDILYVRLPKFGGNDENGDFVDQPVIDILRSLVEQAVSHSGFLLDLRANGGGYPTVYMALASWLYPTPTDLFRCRSKTGPGHDALGPWWSMTSTPDPELAYDGPMAVLVDPRTVSAGDFSSAFLHLTGRAKTFGAPSAGGFGNRSTKDVDPAWSVSFNDILCADFDGNNLEGHPPPVDFPVTYTVEDVVSGTDTVIEAARAWLEST